MIQKTVIFIGGTAYSGSTLMDLILGSGNECMSLGEVRFLFYPVWRHHLDLHCGCGDINCLFWRNLKEKSRNTIYNEIIKTYPNKKILVDSSKAHFWIYSQSKYAQINGFNVKHVLIWKTPLEYAASRFKRGQLDGWDLDWKNYHRRYMSLFNEWTSVKYADLANDTKNTLKSVCNSIGIENYEGKEKYWNWKQHTLFGNNSAKISLYEKNTNGFNASKQWLEDVCTDGQSNHWGTDSYRKIIYDNKTYETLPKEVLLTLDKDQEMNDIFYLLKAKHVGIGRQPITTDGLEMRLKIPFHIILLLMWFSKLNNLRKRAFGLPEQIIKH